MMLSVAHFLDGSNPNVSHLGIEDIDHVLCYHATRLPSPACVLHEGIRRPSVDGLRSQLSLLGIEDVDSDLLADVFGCNGANTFTNLSRSCLADHCDYHRKGSEKVRGYIFRACRHRYDEAMAQITRDFVACIFELRLPVEYFDESCLYECFDEPEEMLRGAIEEVDVTLEVTRAIPPQFISAHWCGADLQAAGGITDG